MLDSPDILCMLISKLPGGIMERWNRKVSNIRRSQVREPTLDYMTDLIEALADYHTKLERPVRQKQIKNYTIKTRCK